MRPEALPPMETSKNTFVEGDLPAADIVKLLRYMREALPLPLLFWQYARCGCLVPATAAGKQQVASNSSFGFEFLFFKIRAKFRSHFWTLGTSVAFSKAHSAASLITSHTREVGYAWQKSKKLA